MTKLYILNGADRGKSFDIVGETLLVGRSPENDIQIKDPTVSRSHLRILRQGQGLFIEDMQSKNGTFFNGERLRPGEKRMVKEGVPIIIGMTVVCIGKGCVELILPFLDSIELSRANETEQAARPQNHRTHTAQKNIDLIYKVAEIQGDMLDRDLKDALGRILANIFDLMKRVDRAAIILVDPETRDKKMVVSRTRKGGEEGRENYCPGVVDRVIREGKPVVMLDTVQEEASGNLETLKALKIRSVMCLPLLTGTRTLGAMYIDSLEKPYGFRREDQPLFVDISRRIAAALEHCLLREKLEE